MQGDKIHETYKWIESEDLEKSKVKNLKFPFKFKHLSCTFSIDVYCLNNRQEILLYSGSISYEELFRAGLNFKWLRPKK